MGRHAADVGGEEPTLRCIMVTQIIDAAEEVVRS